ncbi:MAG: hypothetical protein VCC00_01905 [Deltaproteobacteria bacterium]
MSNAKNSVWVLYLVSALAMLFADGWMVTAARWVLGLTFTAHFIEFFVKRSVMEKAGGSMGGHFVQTMIYGLFHWKPLENQQQSAD